ncbi:MAG: hypothetical protein R3F31_23375 [Verrucomicrobiales bacterium]
MGFWRSKYTWRFSGRVEHLLYVAACVAVLTTGQTHLGEAHKSMLRMAQLVRTPMVSTDPPYYDNIGYAALSDFYV